MPLLICLNREATKNFRHALILFSVLFCAFRLPPTLFTYYFYIIHYHLVSTIDHANACTQYAISLTRAFLARPTMTDDMYYKTMAK